MKITKVINNNTVSTVMDDGNEAILAGSGIGYHKKAGDEVSPRAIERVYQIQDKKTSQYEQLFKRIPSLYFEIAEDITKRAEKNLKVQLNSQLIFALTDHISFAIERQKRGDSMPNLMLQEVRLFYGEEFKIGEYGRKLLQEKTRYNVPIDEAGYIALHIVNARLKDSSIDINNVLVMSKGIIDIVSETFHIQIDEDEFSCNRFITHLKLLAKRIFKHEVSEMVSIEEMYPILIAKDKRLKEVTERIKKFMLETFDYELSLEESIYLLMHIIRVVNL